MKLLIKMKESQVLKSIENRLEMLKFKGDIIWSLRINSGMARSGSSYIKLAPAGTPDLCVIVNCGNHIGLLFIEVKRPGVTKLRYEQSEFFKSMEGKPMTLCVVINDPGQLYQAIDKLKEL